MRKFKFVGDPGVYKWDTKPEINKVYNGDQNISGTGSIETLIDGIRKSAGKNDKDFLKDWQEVTGQPNLILNQDMPATSMTKFEMAVFMVLQGLVSNPNTARQIQSTIGRGPTAEESNMLASNTAIALAKETFKQLENEKGRY